MKLISDEVKGFTLTREDIAEAVDKLMADVYSPESGNEYTRDEVERATWSWLIYTITNVLGDVVEHTHGPRGLFDYVFKKSLRTAAKKARQ